MVFQHNTSLLKHLYRGIKEKWERKDLKDLWYVYHLQPSFILFLFFDASFWRCSNWISYAGSSWWKGGRGLVRHHRFQRQATRCVPGESYHSFHKKSGAKFHSKKLQIRLRWEERLHYSIQNRLTQNVSFVSSRQAISTISVSVTCCLTAALGSFVCFSFWWRGRLTNSTAHVHCVFPPHITPASVWRVCVDAQMYWMSPHIYRCLTVSPCIHEHTTAVNVLQLCCLIR